MLQRLNNQYSQRGDSLIEIVIVAFFLATMFTALISLVVMSTARNRLAKERAVATRLAQEGMEGLRSLRDQLGYSVFSASIVGTQNYCLTDVTSLIVCSPADCSTCPLINGNLRYVTLTDPSTGQVTITMQVKWADYSPLHTVTQMGVLDQWQR